MGRIRKPTILPAAVATRPGYDGYAMLAATLLRQAVRRARRARTPQERDAERAWLTGQAPSLLPARTCFAALGLNERDGLARLERHLTPPPPAAPTDALHAPSLCP